MLGHRLAEERSLALHAEVVRRLRVDPAVLERARARVTRWLSDGGPTHPRYAGAWRDLLAGEVEAVCAALGDPGDRMRALRQCTPFAGVVDSAQGVAPETAILPAGWERRAIAVRGPGTRGATGWCPEIHDLVASKLVAGGEKELDFAEVAAREALVDAATLRERVTALPLAEAPRELVRRRVEALFLG